MDHGHLQPIVCLLVHLLSNGLQDPDDANNDNQSPSQVQGIQESAARYLSSLLSSHLQALAHQSMELANLSCRSCPNVADLAQVLRHFGLSAEELIEHWTQQQATLKEQQRTRGVRLGRPTFKVPKKNPVLESIFLTPSHSMISTTAASADDDAVKESKRPKYWEPHLPEFPSDHTYVSSHMSWRPDALSKQVLVKRKTQIRQVEENLKRLLLPSDPSSKYERKLEKYLLKSSNKKQQGFMTGSTQASGSGGGGGGLLIAHKDMSLINYETSRFGGSFASKQNNNNRKRSHHHVELPEELDVDLEDAAVIVDVTELQEENPDDDGMSILVQ